MNKDILEFSVTRSGEFTVDWYYLKEDYFSWLLAISESLFSHMCSARVLGSQREENSLALPLGNCSDFGLHAAPYSERKPVLNSLHYLLWGVHICSKCSAVSWKERGSFFIFLRNVLNKICSFFILVLTYEPPGELGQTPAAHISMTALGEENACYGCTENENGIEFLRLGSYGVLNIQRWYWTQW